MKPRSLWVVALLRALDEETEDVVYRYREYHQKDVYRLAPAVEYQADHEQHDVSELQRYDEIDKQRNCQKRKQEFET